MNAEEHATQAERILQESQGSIDLAFLSRSAFRAQSHATLALALEQRNTNVWLQDLAGQLDRKMPQPDRPPIDVAVACRSGVEVWWLHECGHAERFPKNWTPVDGGCDACGSRSDQASDWRLMFVAAR